MKIYICSNEHVKKEKNIKNTETIYKKEEKIRKKIIQKM